MTSSPYVEQHEKVNGMIARARGEGRAAIEAMHLGEVIDHLEGRVDPEQMRARALAATRQLARRQLTWLRREPVDRRIAAEAADRLAQALAAIGDPAPPAAP